MTQAPFKECAVSGTHALLLADNVIFYFQNTDIFGIFYRELPKREGEWRCVTVAQRAIKPMFSYKKIRQTNSPARISVTFTHYCSLMWITVFSSATPHLYRSLILVH